MFFTRNKGNGKEKIEISINKKLYSDFCVKCAQENINDVIEGLIENFLNQKDELHSEPAFSKIILNSDMRSNFRTYLLEIAQKTTGEHYSENVSRTYTSAINSISQYVGKNLWEVNSSELKDIIETLQNDNKFFEIDKKKSSILSNGIKRYKEFLDYYEMQS